MSRRPAVTILFHRDGAVESRSFRVPVWMLRIGAIGGTTVLVLILIGAALYAPIARTAARVPALNRELARLRAENAQVQELATALAQVESRYQQVRTMLGGDVVPERGDADRTYPTAPPVFAGYPGPPSANSGPSVPNRWPLDTRGVITRGPADAGGTAEAHGGLDVAVPRGTPIRAAGGGVVKQAGSDPEYGLFILVQHPDGFESMYGHASRLLVTAGDTVPVGQVIALSGSTGRSTAPHLHFEIRRAGQYVDPRTVVNQEDR